MLGFVGNEPPGRWDRLGEFDPWTPYLAFLRSYHTVDDEYDGDKDPAAGTPLPTLRALAASKFASRCATGHPRCPYATCVDEALGLADAYVGIVIAMRNSFKHNHAGMIGKRITGNLTSAAWDGLQEASNNWNTFLTAEQFHEHTFATFSGVQNRNPFERPPGIRCDQWVEGYLPYGGTTPIGGVKNALESVIRDSCCFSLFDNVDQGFLGTLFFAHNWIDVHYTGNVKWNSTYVDEKGVKRVKGKKVGEADPFYASWPVVK